MADVKRPGPERQRTLRAERAEVTRHRIAAAARRLFARDGYGATTIKAIAVEAGVAVQTVYAVYGSKIRILDTLREEAMQQPEAGASVAASIREQAVPRRLDLFARSIRQRWELAGDIVAIARAAATSDPAARAGVEETLRVRRAGIASLAQSLERALGPRVDVPRATAILDALTIPEVYAELVDVQGWTPDEFEAWLGATLRHQLLGVVAGE